MSGYFEKSGGHFDRVPDTIPQHNLAISRSARRSLFVASSESLDGIIASAGSHHGFRNDFIDGRS